MRLYTALFPLATLLLSGCSHFANYHPFPKADANSIPSYCQGIWDGDVYGLSGRFSFNFDNDTQEGLVKYRIKNGVINETGTSGNGWFFYMSASTANPIAPYDGFYDGFTLEPINNRQVKQLCGIKEAIDHKKMDRSGTNYIAYLDSSASFDDIEYDKHVFEQYQNGSSFGQMVLFDEANNAVMAKIDFTRKNGESLASATERIFADWLKQASTMIDRVNKSYYEKQIPPLPKRPEKPVGKVISKQNFETSQQFAVRVEAEKEAEALARQKAAESYVKALEDRNQKILDLRKEYTDAIEAQKSENQRVVDWIMKDQERVLAFIAQTIVKSYVVPSPAQVGRGAVGKSVWVGEQVPEYNADTGTLNLHLNYRYGQVGAQILIAPEEAAEYYNKATKNGKEFGYPFSEVKQETYFKDGELIIGKLYARDTEISSQWFEVVENGVQPRARKMEAFVIALPPKDAEFVKSIDGEISHVPSVGGVWDGAAAMKVADLYNPKAPQWFSTPMSKEKIAYGTGLSLDEAKNDALRELAIMQSANISVKQSTKTKVKGTPSAEVSMEKEVNVSTNESYTGSYRIIKQEMMDGRWYVSIQAQKH